MKRIVFYSWQSDLEAGVTRTFIEDALKDAVQRLATDATIAVQPVLDRDTAGVPGTPAIVDTILSKIAAADVFVADVSIINRGGQQRPSPNPNVLVELGFAAARVGWDRILLVQNTSFGGPEILPFDLRHRRVLPFHLQANAPNRDDMRLVLRDQIEGALRETLGNMFGPYTQRRPNEPMWWGYWQTPNEYDRETWGGSLFIHEVGATGFLFQLSVFSGSHTGLISGIARFVSQDGAYATIAIPGEANKQCELSFRRTLKDRREILVEESSDCRTFHGAGVTFDGQRFVHIRETLFEMGAFDELDCERLYGITGQFYRPLMQRFHLAGEAENKDQFPARVISGGVRGNFTSAEAIVMRGSEGQLWAAYIDEEVVRYFTTEPKYKTTLPATMEHWRERFKEKKVILDSQVKTIPILHPGLVGP